ncbi:type II toxin-antitoxin system VapC family toxin [Thioalkalivibrio sp. XN8]|uniref:type II toxin-antitoxin system VapC family toxin n=1 Tax=Thioalkalivibrio sp. XN8 TaxID=2712863 RepID=UPI0013EC0F4A|nr:type II toxin-antitoxin system VapC family toxin [Thioalkalivibrio sp. XN8]NGP53668.1 type II toxin-antitoxin system VapC family toxin [Thioalkalivibrio sp. XN8]
MERLLLDTHVFLWWLVDDPRLGHEAHQLIADSDNTVFVSAATGWEIGIKRALGKLDAPRDLEREVERSGFAHLPVTFFHGEQAGALPPHHRDPFDRMLIAQAQAEGLLLLTADNHFSAYGIRVLAAGT